LASTQQIPFHTESYFGRAMRVSWEPWFFLGEGGGGEHVRCEYFPIKVPRYDRKHATEAYYYEWGTHWYGSVSRMKRG
jgi:hypothetical protein